jgi:hypothetical protein
MLIKKCWFNIFVENVTAFSKKMLKHFLMHELVEKLKKSYLDGFLVG